jgi:hypothetical protein
MTRFRDTRATIAEMSMHPGEVVTVSWDSIRAGLLMRRHLKEALNAARIRGAEVEVHEARGLLESVYAVRLKGTDRQILPTLRYMAELEGL